KCQGQEIKCYCYQSDAPTLLNMQKGADKIAEWILIKGESVAVISYMDKSCDQLWSFFEKKFEEDKQNNRLYQITEMGDSISFTKVFNFIAKNTSMSQENIYNAKVFSDSLKVLITYPNSENSKNTFYDFTGPPVRTYTRVFKK